MSLVKVNEAVGGSIVGVDLAFLTQFRQDSLGQLLSEFDTPLVKGVDVPDDTLHEDLVFIHGNQSTKSSRSQFLEQNGVCGTVALENAVRYNVVGSLGSHFLSDLLLSLANHQGFSLSKEVGQQNIMVLAIGNRVVSFDRCQEVARNKFGTLK